MSTNVSSSHGLLFCSHTMPAVSMHLREGGVGETGHSPWSQGAVPLRTVPEAARCRCLAPCVMGLDRLSVLGALWSRVPMPPTGPPANALVPASAEGVGAEAHDDPPAPVTAALGTAGNHDQCVWPHPHPRGEVCSQGDGSVRQQHHLSAVPVPQPAGECLPTPGLTGGPAGATLGAPFPAGMASDRAPKMAPREHFLLSPLLPNPSIFPKVVEMNTVMGPYSVKLGFRIGVSSWYKFREHFPQHTLAEAEGVWFLLLVCSFDFLPPVSVR